MRIDLPENNQRHIRKFTFVSYEEMQQIKIALVINVIGQVASLRVVHTMLHNFTNDIHGLLGLSVFIHCT